MVQEERISVPFKIKKKHYLGKGYRMIESPEGGGEIGTTQEQGEDQENHGVLRKMGAEDAVEN